MTIEITLRENDFLQLYLYLLKMDNSIRKQLIKEWIFWFPVSLAFFYIGFNFGNLSLAAFLGVGILAGLTIRTYRIKNIYFKLYKKITKSNYECIFGTKFKLTINDEYYELIGQDSESKKRIKTVANVIETKQHFFIRLKPETIIIPKAELENVNFVREKLKEFSAQWKVQYTSDLKWKW